MKFGFVILNFLTSSEAIAAVKSVNKLESDNDDTIQVYVVDNASPEKVFQELSSALSIFNNVKVMQNTANLGFAKGNNIGIDAALEDGCDFVTCLNNDVELSSETNFLQTCKDIYRDKNVAVIGPKILDSNDNNQNPFLKHGPTPEQKQYRKKIYGTFIGWLKYWVSRYYLPMLLSKKSKTLNNSNKNVEHPDGVYYALHGSVLIFTPSFFNNFKGFDPATFLYGEELILAEMVTQSGLKSVYTSQITAHHAEDVSTDVFLKNKSKERFCLKHEYNSIRHLVNKYY